MMLVFSAERREPSKKRGGVLDVILLLVDQRLLENNTPVLKADYFMRKYQLQVGPSMASIA